MKRFVGKKRSVGPPSKHHGPMEKSRKVDLSLMIDLAIEIWRLQDRVKKLESATGRHDPSIAFSIDKIQHVLREIGIETRDLTGQAYNEGLSLDVLTFSYPLEEKPLARIVQETVSPAIFFEGKLQKMAQVIVGKADDNADDKKHD